MGHFLLPKITLSPLERYKKILKNSNNMCKKFYNFIMKTKIMIKRVKKIMGVKFDILHGAKTTVEFSE